MHTIIGLLYGCVLATCLFFGQTLLKPTDNSLVRNIGLEVDPPLRDCVSCGNDDNKDTTYWAVHTSGPGVTVFGFPSKGGIYMLRNALGVELNFLGFDRFNDTPRPLKSDPDRQAKEDAHCYRMRQLGAVWWRSIAKAFEKEILGLTSENDSFIQVGWPESGGVWVLHTTEGGASEKGAGMVHNAYNMEERCKAIERLGGVFYTNPQDCIHLDLS